MGLLTKIEETISIPMEFLHNRKGFQPVDLCRMAQKCLEQGVRKGIKRVYAPNRFHVLLHPADFLELEPFLEMIKDDISSDLDRIIKERNYLLAGLCSCKKLIYTISNL